MAKTRQEVCRDYYLRNKEAINAKSRAKYRESLEANRAKARAAALRSYYRHHERNKAAARAWAAANKVAHNAASRAYYYRRKAENREAYLAQRRKYLLARYKTSPAHKCAVRLRGRLNALIKNRRGTVKAGSVRHNWQSVVHHLERQFKDGMTWDNHGRDGWHIDHIVPCAAFDLTKPEEIERCFALSNLQPMWASDNMSKGAKLNWRPAA